jgi:hypothetical protein
MVVASVPEIDTLAPHELKHRGCDIYHLLFNGPVRSCEIYRYGKNQWPDAFFYWDQCFLFRFRVDDDQRLIAVLKRWLCDKAMPSALRIEFPWLEIGPLADYYEQGNPIEGEFITSWDSIEAFYRGLKFNFVPSVLALIAELRRRGYDRVLRAGQSLATLIVSRSRRHGLRIEQPMIAFDFPPQGMIVRARLGAERTLDCEFVQLAPEVETLLQKLVEINVD